MLGIRGVMRHRWFVGVVREVMVLVTGLVLVVVGPGVGLRDGWTLDDELGEFGDLVTELGVPPTVREFGARLGVSSESVAYRWVRVLDGDGSLAANVQLSQGVVVTGGGGGLAVGAVSEGGVRVGEL